MSRLRSSLDDARAAVREFFTLEKARAELARVGAEASTELARELALSDQRAAAAEALHWQGHRVESLRLAKEALGLAVDAGKRYVEARGGSPVSAPRALDLRGVPIALVEQVDRDLDELTTLAIPTHESDAGDDAEETYARLRGVRSVLADALVVPASVPESLRRTLWSRRVATAVLLLAAFLGVRWVMARPISLDATASAVLSNAPTFAASQAVDGSPATFWLLPDRSPGTLDLAISPPERVRTLAITNSTNPPYMDRATRDYTVVVYSRGRVAKRFDAHFEWADAPVPVVHDIGVDAVDRIRIEVKSFHRLGAGIAEIEAR